VNGGDKILHTINWRPTLPKQLWCYKALALREPILVHHGALSQSRVYELLCSKDARVRRAAFILLETSNPTLRRNSEVFLEIIRFIWNANPNYDVYREFSKRHMLVPYKVHELISARLKIEKREQQSAILDQHTEHRRQRQGRFFARLFRRRPTSKAIDPLGR
jgi:hypothetical protein